MSPSLLGKQLQQFLGVVVPVNRHKRRRPRGVGLRSVERLEERSLMAMAGVDIVNFAFTPNPVTIHVGDTVEWVWNSDDHSTTSVAGSVESWDSGVQNTGFMFEHTFTHVGTFVYYCKIHGVDNGNGTASGMSGSIIVLPPSPLMAIMVTPANASTAAGTTEQYMAMGMYADNTIEDVTNDVTWASSNTAVASISNNAASQGLATAAAQGSSTISASLDGLTGTTTLTVTAPPPLISVTNVAIVRNKRHMVTGLTIEFSGIVNASEADNVGTYALTVAGKKGSFVTKNATHLKLKSAVYNAALDTVTLTPKKAFALSKAVQVLIHGQPPGGLQDSLGRFIDGNVEGQASDDGVFVLTKKGAARG
jgi:plastocyanin